MSALHLIGAAVCLALLMDTVMRRGPGSLQLALCLCLGGASLAILSLVVSASCPDAASAWPYTVSMRVGGALASVGSAGVGLALASRDGRWPGPWALGLGAALVAGGALAVGLSVPVEALVRSRWAWSAQDLSVRVVDTGLGLVASLVCLGGVVRGMAERPRRAWRPLLWVLGVQAFGMTSIAALRWTGSLDVFHGGVILVTACTVAGYAWALRTMRVGGLQGEALELLFVASPLPIAILDLNMNSTLLNAAARELLRLPGASPSAVVEALGLGHDAGEVLASLHGTRRSALRIPRAPGREFDLQCAHDARRGLGLLVLSEVTERVGHARSLAHALEELRDAQARLVAQERMAALGGLIAGINHELNNPVAYVGASVRAASDYLATLAEGVRLAAGAEGEGEGARAARAWAASADVRLAAEDGPEALAEAQQGCERLADIVLALRTLSRQGEPEQHAADLAALVRAGVKVGRTALSPSVRVQVDVQGPLPVHGVPGELSAVVTNLVANAGEALGEQGRVWVRAWREGGFGVVEVADDGPGIPPELLSRIFEPFFTTKRSGTGLGLAICYETARRHHGELTVESAPGQGARFRLRLPLEPEAVTTAAAQDAGPPVRSVA